MCPACTAVVYSLKGLAFIGPIKVFELYTVMGYIGFLISKGGSKIGFILFIKDVSLQCRCSGLLSLARRDMR